MDVDDGVVVDVCIGVGVDGSSFDDESSFESSGNKLSKSL